MRRRHKDPSELVPRHLAVFSAREWPGNKWEAFAAWKRARMAYCDETGWPGGPVELIREHVNVRRELLGLPRIEHVASLGRQDHDRRRVAELGAI